MNTIMEAIIFISVGIIGGLFFNYLKKRVTEKVKAKISEKITGVIPEESSKGESFSIKKFVEGMTNVASPVGWAKDIQSIFNFRKLAIYTLVIGVIFGYGYWKGLKEKPVHFNLQGKEATICLNEHFLKIEKDGTAKVIDKQGRVLKVIKVTDIPELEKALKPIGVDVKLIGVVGVGVGDKIKQEAGAGLSFFKYYDWRASAVLTNAGAYVGVDYDLGKKIKAMPNSFVGAKYGKGYKGDDRILIHLGWYF
jgi:hypothetical protein